MINVNEVLTKVNMAEQNSTTITEYSGENTEERSKNRFEKRQRANNDMNNEARGKTFTVHNYRDYNVHSDVENVLNLNPVRYIDDFKALRNEENRKTSDTKDGRESLSKSLITIGNGKDKHSSISASIKIASHIIAPATSCKGSVPVRRIPRRDDSEKNYYDDLALNEHTISLFGGHKKRKSLSVI